MEDDASKDEKSNYISLKIEIRQLLKDTFNRKVLSEVLLDLRKDISGEAQQSLFSLYQDLGLHKDSFAKLKSWRWQIVSKGILDLTQMEVAESYGFITKFINDKRSTIRKQAEIATVTLRHEGINYFLDTTKYRISEWQQLKLLDVIRNKEDFQPPRFRAWLTSNNKYVVLFALRLIKHYNQNDANTFLIELVKHKNNQIKEEAIACIKEFNVTDSLDTLKLVFWNASIIVKIAILDAIAEIGSEADIEFINLIDKKELNFSVKSKALSTINAISPESIMPSKGIQDESHYQIPNDITAAAAKKHAKKHEDLSGDKDEEIIDNDLVELLTSEDEASYTLKDEASQTEKPEGALEVDTNDEDSLTPVRASEEIETPTETKEIIAFHDIEAEVEELIAGEAKTDKKELAATDWEADHLNFIPLVVLEEEHENKYAPNDLNKPKYTASMEEVFNIEVVYEELVPHQESIDSKEDAPTEKPLSLVEEFNLGTLAFLPIVVDNEQETQAAQIEKSENEKTNLLDIPVMYDEVQSNVPEEKQNAETMTSALETLNEPVHKLKDIKLPAYSKNDSSLGYARYNTAKIRNAILIYEEITHKEADLDVMEIEVVAPIYISTENKSKQILDVTFKHEENIDEVELPIESEQILQKIIDDLIAVDRPSADEHTVANDSNTNPDWDLDEDNLAFIPVSFDKDSEELPSYIKIEKTSSNTIDEDANIPPASIPKAIFGDIDFEASTRQLLNDLEEMGDQREIPLLKELLAHDTYDMFKVRINSLIDAFNHNEPKEKIDNDIHPFSVFQDLFRTCDTESKMILLNEVVEVGDEKEIHFLEGLTEDDSPAIKKKALEVLKDLKIKLEKIQNESKKQDEHPAKVTASFNFEKSWAAASMEPSNDPNDIFDLNFDFTGELDENEDKKNRL